MLKFNMSAPLAVSRVASILFGEKVKIIEKEEMKTLIIIGYKFTKLFLFRGGVCINYVKNKIIII